MLTLLLFGCTPDPELPTSGSFSALTYNVHGLPPEITGDDTAARMVLISPLLNRYDLVGLQEDFDEDNHATLEANAQHPTKVRFDEVLDDRVYGPGLAIFTQQTELSQVNTHYEACYGVLEGASDCLASKGFQILRVALGAGELDIYNTHMEAGNSAEDDEARDVQAAQLIEAMATISADRAVLFMGDTNLADDDPEDLPVIQLILEEAGLLESCEVLSCPEPGRIDRFLYRSGGGLSLDAVDWAVDTDFVDEEGVALSDHDAITAQFEWRYEDPTAP